MMTMTMTMMMTTMMMTMTKKHPAKNARFVATSLSFSALFTMVAGLEISNQVTQFTEEQNAKMLADIQPSVSQITEAVPTTEAPVFAEEVVVKQAAPTATTTSKKKKKKKATSQPSAEPVVTVEAAPVAPAPAPAPASAPVETVVTVVEVAPAADATSAAS